MGIGTPLINGLATAGDVISGYQLPGNNDQIARIVSYRISDGKVGATQSSHGTRSPAESPT